MYIPTYTHTQTQNFEINKSLKTKVLFKKKKGWRDDSEGKSTSCSSRRPGFKASAHITAHNCLLYLLQEIRNLKHSGKTPMYIKMNTKKIKMFTVLPINAIHGNTVSSLMLQGSMLSLLFPILALPLWLISCRLSVQQVCSQSQVLPLISK